MTESTPEEAAKKLANLIPAPDDVPTDIVPKDSPQIVSAGGPAPPLHAFVVDDEKKGKKPRTRPTVAAPNTAKRDVEKMLPSTVRAHVYKVNRVGKRAFVGDYSANELIASGSIERFLHEYVVPEFEYGEYSVYMQSPGKELEPAGSVVLEEPLSHRKKDNGSETREIIELIAKRDAEARQAAANQKDPIEQMRETAAFLESMRGGREEKIAMDPMMGLFMTMLQPKAPPVSSGPDPIMLRILERLDRIEETNHLPMLPPPPPPPPPPPDPMGSIAPILEMMIAQQKQSTDLLIAAMSNRSNPVEDLARLSAITGATDDRMTTKDLLAMLPTIKDMIAPNRERSGLSEAMETLRSVKLLEREFGGSQADQSASSFWDFLRDFITSDAGAKIAEAIMAQDAVKKVDERQQQRRVATQNATNEAKEPEEDNLVIPESFREKHAVAINTASTPSERLEALIRGLQHLGAYPEFRPYMAKIIGLMKENRKIECLEFVGSFLEAMIEAGALEIDPSKKALEDLKNYWVLVRKQLKMPDVPEVFPEGMEPQGTPAKVDADDTGDDNDEPENEPEQSEIDPPRRSRRNPQRDVTPLDPTPEQMAAQEALRRSREEELVTSS